VSVVFASIELQAWSARLRCLIHHLGRRSVDDLVKRVDTLIADMALITGNHARHF
jgi:hypothetical protein